MQPLSSSALIVRPKALLADAPPGLRPPEQYSAIPKPATVQKRRILSIGNDPALVNSRELVLQSAGHDVVSIASSAALSRDLLQKFDLVLLCHTVKSRDEVIQFIRLVRPGIPLLLLDEICCEPPRAGEVHVSPKPEVLLNMVENLLPSQARAT